MSPTIKIDMKDFIQYIMLLYEFYSSFETSINILIITGKCCYNVTCSALVSSKQIPINSEIPLVLVMFHQARKPFCILIHSIPCVIR